MRGRKAAEQQLVIKLVKGIIVGLDRWIIYVILDTQQFYGVKMCSSGRERHRSGKMYKTASVGIAFRFWLSSAESPCG
jgi:hypothetical protein